MTSAPAPDRWPVVQVRRTLAASPEELFRAWTEPDLFRQWFKPRGGSIPSAEMDVRVGGRYRIAVQRLGLVYYAVGEYLELDAPTKLVSTFGWERVPLVRLSDSLLTVEFVAREGQTEVVITHERLRNRALRGLHGWGWRSNLKALARGLARSRGSDAMAAAP
jgi:uncharacterized protein YndB with AHSA1/START domain